MYLNPISKKFVFPGVNLTLTWDVFKSSYIPKSSFSDLNLTLTWDVFKLELQKNVVKNGL